MTSAHTSTRTLNSGTSLQTPRTALIVAGVVLFFGMLSFYGYLLQSQVKRGEAFREAHRAGLSMWSETAACCVPLRRQALKMDRC